MVSLYYCNSQEQLPPVFYNAYLASVPVFLREDICRYHRWEDQQRNLFGKLLLRTALQEIGSHLTLENILYTGYQKPYFTGEVNFNISHSGDYVICAVSETEIVGVDIEEIKSISFSDFDSEFSAVELAMIYSAPDSLNAFYHLWTQKEAFLKALGKGLQVPLREVHVQRGKIDFNQKTWHLTNATFDESHPLHLCTDKSNVVVNLKRVDMMKTEDFHESGPIFN